MFFAVKNPLLTAFAKIARFPVGNVLVRFLFVLFPVWSAMMIRFRFPLLAGMIPLVLFLFACGCTTLLPGNLFPGWKKDKESQDTFITETEDGKPKLIGDYVSIGNNFPVLVHGFGLVVNLPDTGGDDSNTLHHRMVYDDMNRKKVTGINSILLAPNTAVVEVTGLMHPGIQKDERFDVQISLPRDTNTRSLRGGMLMETRLAEMQPSFRGDVLAGSPRASAAGPIMVDDPMATDSTNPSGLKKGTILSGARVTAESRSLSLIMKEKSFVGADQIAKAINHRFHLSGSRKGVATAETDALIVLDIHPSYVSDVPRYIRVVQSIACYETQIQQLKRIERLKEDWI